MKETVILVTGGVHYDYLYGFLRIPLCFLYVEETTNYRDYFDKLGKEPRTQEKKKVSCLDCLRLMKERI